MADSTDRLNAALEGRYRIERELGEGGMATVYLAEDLKHNRQVAVKVLKPELAAVLGAERFLAEIETTANLQHPHILPLFDSGEADGFLFFVMPYVEGESLRDRLERERQLPVDEAVGIAAAVGSALSAAHERGVVHRDIKPANILLSRGEPLVADFGIAIAVTSSSGARLTETGLSLGTPYYMSPEQATGDREVTAASDVYALGCVLYEMLVGDPPYEGSTAQAVLGKILTEKPRSPTEVRAAVPPNVDGAILRALEKVPADRFTTASGFVRAIEDPAFRYGQPSGAADGRGERTWKRVAAGLAVVTMVSLGLLLRSTLGGPEAAPASVVLELDVGDLEVDGDIAISDDGTTFVAAGEEPRQLWIRRLGESDFHPIPGTEGAVLPDFSPDGSWIVFRDNERNALLKVPVAGGGALSVMDVDSISPWLPRWGPGGIIVFTGPQGLYRVADTGEGGPHRMADGGFPRDVLPDGSGVLVEADGNVLFLDFETDSATVLFPGTRPHYLETGHILYGTGGSSSLFAVPFDLDRHEITGSPTPVLDGVAADFASAGFDVSDGGILVYREGQASTVRPWMEPARLLLAEGNGSADTVPLTPRPLMDPRISPDGRYVAYQTYVGGDTENRQIQIYDLLTGSSPEVTASGDNIRPVWSPDGTRLAFSSRRGDSDVSELYTVPADGSAPSERILGAPAEPATRSEPAPDDWSDGDVLVLTSWRGGDTDLQTLAMDSAGAEPRTYLGADYSERRARISPDGTLLVYESLETGRSEVFVRGFPEPVGKWRVSVEGGRAARWAPEGDELYFWRADSLFSVPLQREPDFVPGRAEPVLTGDYFTASWDVHPDGRFLLVQGLNPETEEADGDAPEPRHLVVLNWFTALRERLGEAN